MYNELFNPQSIALVGASHLPGKLGFDILSNLKNLGFKGKIYPINPKGGEVLGLKVFATVNDLPEVPDLVLIVIPAPLVNDAVKDCGEKGVKNVVVISAGFKETGGEGVRREEALKQICETYKINLIGPNCLGVISTKNLMNASFAEGMPAHGNASLISQSGAMAVAMIDWAYESGLGFSKIVSMGNKTGLNENDFLAYLGDDPETEVILMYLESIADGERFLELAREISLKKPIVIVKSGTSEAGTKAISSHTGSLAGSDIAVATAFRQGGIIRADTIEDLFDYAKGFSYQKPPRGNRVAIVTNAGGPGIMATDALSKTPLVLAELTDETKQTLAAGLPPTAALGNPVDVIGDALANRYRLAVSTLLEDPQADSLLVILTPQVMTEVKAVSSLVTSLSHQHADKTVLSSFVGGENIIAGKRLFERHRFPNYPYPERAVHVLEKMSTYSEWQRKELKRLDYQEQLPPSPRTAETDAVFVGKEPGTRLSYAELQLLSRVYGIPLPEVHLATTPAEAVKFSEDLKYPVVMKIASPDIYHKTDVGGIRVDIKDEAEAIAAYNGILENVKAKAPKARITGITVEPMLSIGKEVIVGVNRDPQFGHMLMFGLGGIYVEVLKDVTFRIAPISAEEAKEMIHEIKAIRILKGARGEAPVDIDAIADIIVKVGQIVTDYPQISEFEINPLFASSDRGTIAADIKCIV